MLHLVKAHTPKFIKKYMHMARQIAEDNDSCFSRRLGAVIVDPFLNKVVGTGYNGPPKDMPSPDSAEHWRLINPLLESGDRIGLMSLDLVDPLTNTDIDMPSDKFVEKCKGQCPRRILKAPSGQRLELCGCVHTEINAIINAARDLTTHVMYVWGPSPCMNCGDAIIQSGIAAVYYCKEQELFHTDNKHYCPLAAKRLEMVGVRLIGLTYEEIENG